RGDGFEKASLLLAQARDAGLAETNPDSWEDIVAELKKVASIPLNQNEYLSENSEYELLAKERKVLLNKKREIRDEIALVKSFEQDKSSFSKEAKKQKSRLKTIGLFEDSNETNVCPLCSHNLSETVPSEKEIKETFVELSKKFESLSKTKLQLEKPLSELEDELQTTRQSLSENYRKMEAIRATNDYLADIQEEAVKRAHIRGRITLYLESLSELDDAKKVEEEVERIRAKLDRLDDDLSDEKIQDNLDSIISIIGNQLTKWAQKLKLEHSKFPLRFEPKRLTIVADTNDGPVPMKRMGSGENWVGYHLIVHLALHLWFVCKNRPVPNFIFFDQPSQVYFPAEQYNEKSLENVSEEDALALSRMFELVIEVINEVEPNLQVIVTEHADIDKEWYQEAIVERWRDGVKLVPEDWPREK
ncbi:MAG: DUF3732 domain-containing protein, partial [Nanoarchaeota archaeon]